MSDADIAEILQLPIAERLRLVQLIWDSVAAETSAVPLGDAHRTVIDQRLADEEANPDDVASRNDVLAEARRR
jgi:putative addiction module component (TIGR02574 family)